MRNTIFAVSILLVSGVAYFPFHAGPKPAAKAGAENPESMSFEQDAALIRQGEHLVMIAGCHDCHTPKKMTPQGPVLDMSLALSGHPSKMPPPDVDRKNIEQKGLTATQTLTAWVGPWGVSYAANLTPDPTGLGNWTEKNFVTAIRQGKHKGIASARMLLPPMPWEMYANMTDTELKAIYFYLKSIKPVKNNVPDPLPPVLASGGK